MIIGAVEFLGDSIILLLCQWNCSEENHFHGRVKWKWTGLEWDGGVIREEYMEHLLTDMIVLVDGRAECALDDSIVQELEDRSRGCGVLEIGVESGFEEIKENGTR